MKLVKCMGTEVTNLMRERVAGDSSVCANFRKRGRKYCEQKVLSHFFSPEIICADEKALLCKRIAGGSSLMCTEIN